MRFSVPFFALVLLALPLGGCTKNIPNTSVVDTPENRDVIQFMERYRHAVEERNVEAILGMVSPRYLDGVGTPTGDDDLDSDTLPERLSAWRARVSDVRYEIRYHEVRYEMGRVYVEYTYTSSFRMADSDGRERWRNVVRDARAILTRDENDELRFLSGL